MLRHLTYSANFLGSSVLSVFLRARDPWSVVRGPWSFFTIFLLLLSTLPSTRAASVNADEAVKIKAAFILNFARFVEWPTNVMPQQAPVTIGILGEDPFGPIIDATMAGKTVEQRRIAVVRLSRLSAAMNCHVLFISSSEQDRLPRILGRLQGKPILTVSDTEGFCEHGGMIRLKRKGGTIRFDINWAAADRAGLKVSSKLLKLADNAPARQ